jgi:hypothetical protein
VITTQPTATAYVSADRENQDHVLLPTIGLIFSIIQLSICLAFLNILAAGCLVPALICAIVGLAAPPDKAKMLGNMSIWYNVAHLCLWILSVIIICIAVPLSLRRY